MAVTRLRSSVAALELDEPDGRSTHGPAGAEIADAAESLVEASDLGVPNGTEQALDETRRCAEGEVDAGLGETPLRIRQSQEPGSPDEVELGEVEHHRLAEVDGSLQGRPEIKSGQILEPPMQGEQSTPAFESGRQLETRGIRDERHDARLGNFIGEGCQRRLPNRLISGNRSGPSSGGRGRRTFGGSGRRFVLWRCDRRRRPSSRNPSMLKVLANTITIFATTSELLFTNPRAVRVLVAGRGVAAGGIPTPRDSQTF